MIGGFNHNIRYRDRVFHVQTEDLGPNAARIRTHVFFNGTVVADAHQSYADLMRFAMNPPQRAGQIRARMQALHKNTMKLLTQGSYDAQIYRVFQGSIPPGPAPAAAPSVGQNVDDPELQSMLGRVQTTRPAQNQEIPSLQPASALPAEAEPAQTPEPEPEEKALEEDIPGRAKRLFAKKEKSEDPISEAQRIRSAKISRSQSSMVKNRKQIKDPKLKQEEERARQRKAIRSRGINQGGNPEEEKAEQKTNQIKTTKEASQQSVPRKPSNPSNQPETPAPTGVPANSPPQTQAPQARVIQPQIPGAAMRPAAHYPPPQNPRTNVRQAPVQNSAPPNPNTPSGYPMQNLPPQRPPGPAIPPGPRPPVAMVNSRPPVPGSRPGAASQVPGPYPGGYKPR